MSKKRSSAATRWQKPGVAFQPVVSRGMQRGINQIIDLVSPTLGPSPRVTMLESAKGRNHLPEILDDGGTMVRRILEIPGREEDVGAMLIRRVLWELHERVGDGTATAAVIFRDVYNEGLRCITAGNNAMRLRHYLEQGLRLITARLSEMTFQLEGKEALAGLAETICHDREIAEYMGEIFDIIGAYGRIEIRKGQGRESEREYVEGMYWDSGAVSRLMYADRENLKAEIEDAAVLVTDLDIKQPRETMLPLAAALKREFKSLLLIVAQMSDPCVGVLLNPDVREKVETLVVKTPGVSGSKRAGFLQDIAILTGATPLIGKAGETITSLRPEHLGRVRRAWADRSQFGIVGGMGDPRELREHVARLRTAFENETGGGTRRELQERIGKLMGGTAVLRVGAFTEMQLEERKDLAKRTADAMRAAIREGVLPGGGAALLACRPALQERLEQAVEPEERAAYRILLRAVEAPARTLLKNAGHEASALMGELDRADAGCGFDLTTGQVVDMVEAGVLDAAAVLKAATHSAISSAALALTTDAIVHIADPEVSYET